MNVLGKPAEDRAIEDAVVGPQDGALLDRHAAFEDAARADRGARLDDAEGTDLDIRPELGRGANDRRGVNTHERHLTRGRE